MNDSSIRLVRKRFKCLKCHEYESKLVRPEARRNPCSNCQGLLFEVNEKEYQIQKHKVNSNDIKTTKSIPIKPTQEHYKEHYEGNKQNNIIRHSTQNIIPNSTYERPPSNNTSKRTDNSSKNYYDNYPRSSNNNFSNANANGNGNDTKNDSNQSRVRFQSNDNRTINNRRYSNQTGNSNINNNNYRINNNNNINTNHSNNYTNSNAKNNDYNDGGHNTIPRHRQQETSNYDNVNNHPNELNGFNSNNIFRNIFNQDNIGGRRGGNGNGNGGVGLGVGNRNRSVQPTIHVHNPQGVFVIRSTPNYMPLSFGETFFQNFFGEPQQTMSPIFQPQIFSMPFNIRVHRHNFDEGEVFDPEFNTFGSTLNGFFLDNFASNFRSNLENDMFEQLVNAIQDNLLQAESRKTKKTKKETLNSLKKFDMTEKYCKKGKNGKLEFPNCCICLSDIGKGETTVLLPCGHMFHWKCCYSWLKENNTCPVCRFELPAENGEKTNNNS